MNPDKTLYALVARIPKGRVTTYGALAKKTGIKSPRLVGRILHNNPDPHNTPCHRVVTMQGKLARSYASGGMSEQASKLRKDGITVIGDSIRLLKYLWIPA